MRFTDQPRQRFKRATINTLSSETFPNVFLGLWLASGVEYLAGTKPFSVVLLGGGAWLLSVFVYSWAEAIRIAIENAKRDSLGESDYKGIE